MRPIHPAKSQVQVRIRVAAVAVAVAVAFGPFAVACGSDTTTTAGPPATTAAPATSAPLTTAPTTTEPLEVLSGQATMRDYEFLPPVASIAVGETLTWTNLDDFDHWVLTDDGTTVDSGAIGPGESFTATVAAPGEYGYYCDIHNAMTGTIVVA